MGDMGGGGSDGGDDGVGGVPGVVGRGGCVVVPSAAAENLVLLARQMRSRDDTVVLTVRL